MAPLAPTAGTSDVGWASRYARLPASPLTTYSKANFAAPRRRSTGRPNTARYSRFASRWSQPACRNVLVNSVTSAAGPALPCSESNTSAGTNPHRRKNPSNPPPKLSSRTNPATFAATSTHVTMRQPRHEATIRDITAGSRLPPAPKICTDIAHGDLEGDS